MKRHRRGHSNRVFALCAPLMISPLPFGHLLAGVQIGRRWSMTSLLDVLKETDLRVGFSDVFKSLGTREILDRETLRHRLLLCLYGLGTNMGLKRMVSSNHDLTYRELLYTRHRFLEKNAFAKPFAAWSMPHWRLD